MAAEYAPESPSAITARQPFIDFEIIAAAAAVSLTGSTGRGEFDLDLVLCMQPLLTRTDMCRLRPEIVDSLEFVGEIASESAITDVYCAIGNSALRNARADNLLGHGIESVITASSAARYMKEEIGTKKAERASRRIRKNVARVAGHKYRG